MTQGRMTSALEALANLVVGWIVALATQLLVFPVMGLSVTVAQHLGIGAAFTVVSFLRSYCLRRLFERLARRGAPPGADQSTRPPPGNRRGKVSSFEARTPTGGRIRAGE